MSLRGKGRSDLSLSKISLFAYDDEWELLSTAAMKKGISRTDFIITSVLEKIESLRPYDEGEIIKSKKRRSFEERGDVQGSRCSIGATKKEWDIINDYIQYSPINKTYFIISTSLEKANAVIKNS